jgi:S1-C subfamily serine protease
LHGATARVIKLQGRFRRHLRIACLSTRPIARAFAPFLVLAGLLAFAEPLHADVGAQCTSSLSSDGKLQKGADPAKVAEACLAAAAGGNAGAFYLAGLVLEQGIGVPKDAARAENWYRKAAGKGEIPAMLALGRLAEADGKNAQALGWYSRAALKHSRPAQEAMVRLRIADPYAMWGAADFARDIDPALGKEGRLRKMGSGIVIGEDVVLTNEHVVSGCDLAVVSPGLPARVLASDAAQDLAVIKTGIALGEPVPLSGSDDLSTEKDLYTGGYPGIGAAAPDFVMTVGRLAARKISAKDGQDFWLLTNQVHPGNSGGPLMDGSGLVVGVISAELPVTGIVKKDASKDARNGLAIRAAIVRDFLDHHGIAYRTAGAGPVGNASADMKRHAAAATVLVECFAK